MKPADRIAAITAGAPVLLGLLVLVGWAFDTEWLKSPLPGPIIMIPVTAVAMIMTGATVLLIQRPGHNPLAARLLSGFVLLIGAASFFERATGRSLGFDLLMFRNDVLSYPYQPPGLMAINTAFCFALAGMALVVATSERAEVRRFAHWFATAGLAIAALALIGYFLGAKPLYAIDQAAGMALITAIGLAFCHAAILFMLADQGFISMVTKRDSAGGLMRRVVPAAVVLPLILGWLWIRAREMQLVSREGAVALFVLLTAGVIVGLIMRSAILLRASDQAREALLAREAQLRRTAEAANEAKSTFLATMSHELRTPLNAIIGYTALMIDGVPEPVAPVHGAQLERIEASARHLLGLIEDVLTVAHMDVGQQRMSFTTVALEDIVRDSIAIAQPLATVRKLEIHAELPGESVLVATDPVRLRQILLNLIVNAVKFTDEGSVSVTARATDTDIVITVQDTGIGIAPEHLQRIFEPFWQVEQSTTRMVGGSGLGLTVSRQLTGLLGGQLAVQSEVGRGTTFTISLPHARRPFPPAAAGVEQLAGADGRQSD